MNAALLSFSAAIAVLAGTTIPPALTTLERVAEEIDDAVAGGHWAKAQDLEAQGEHALKGLTTERSAAKQRAADALKQARAATEHRATLPTRLAANRLAAAVVDLYEPLNPVVPTSVMRLDVLLRTVDLAALDKMPGESRRALNAVDAIWNNIAAKPPLLGSEAKRSFERQIAPVHRAVEAGDFPAVHDAAVAALEGVDTLEKQYEGGR